ncbi:MAG: NDP-sugar synthase [Thermodesulfobacteria bacterium]|nr:NDP-sugar synthase [Thermodesulfobacteriota bacterium]
MRAFILAAGKGTRLLPYSSILPKPLFPILGQPILKIILKQLISVNLTNIGINCWYLKESLISFLNTFSKSFPEVNLQIFEEKELLGTGGALINARSFFKDTTLVINSDILTNLNFKNILRAHESIGTPVSMVFYKGHNNNVEIDLEKRIVKKFRTKGGSTFTFAGIQVIESELIKVLPCNFDLINSYEELLKKGVKIGAIMVENSYIADIGTPESYLKVHEDLLLKRFEVKECPSFQTPVVFKNCVVKGKVEAKNWVFLEDCVIEDGVILSKVVAWKGARIKKGFYEWKILV